MLAAFERVSVPVPFLVMLALFPARMPETVMVTPESEVNVLLVLVPSVIFPVTELAAVARKFKVPHPDPVSPFEPAGEIDEEIFKAPVRLVVVHLHKLLAPDNVRFPVPAFAVNEFKP